MVHSPSKLSYSHWPEGTLENIVIKAKAGESFWIRFLIQKFGADAAAEFIGIATKELTDNLVDEEPGIFKKGLTATGAAISFVKGGFKLVSKEEREQRMSLCVVCEHFRENKTCAKCGCYMAIKTWLPKMKCPIGKW